MTATHDSRNFFLDGPVGPLEAVLWTPVRAEPAKLAAVICHPHPLFGGTMHNKVIYNAAKALDALGVPTLRFNFRGSGKSAGKHDRGIGEREDVRAALNFLGAEFSEASLLLAGFSFGCWVGLRVGCADPRVTGLIGIGTPVNSSDVSYLRECTKPKLFVHGSHDEHGDLHKLRALVESLPGDNQLEVVQGAEHFFVGKLDLLDHAITSWAKAHYPFLQE